MSWFDGHSTFVRATWSGNQTFPWRFAFWASTDFGSKILMRIQNSSNQDKYAEIGIDGSAQWYAENGNFGGFPAPSKIVGRATSTYAVSRDEFVHVIVEMLGFSSRKIWVNGANSGTNSTTVASTGGPEFHLGASANKNNGSGGTPLMWPDPNVSGSAATVHPNMYRGYVHDFTMWRGISSGGISAAEALRMYASRRPHRFFEPDKIQHQLILGVGSNGVYDPYETVTWANDPILASRRTGYAHYTGNMADGDTMKLGSRTYTFRNSVGTTADEIKIGGSGGVTMGNLCKALDLDGVSGTDYGSDTVAHSGVWGYNLVNQRGDNHGDAAIFYAIDPDLSDPPAIDFEESSSVITLEDIDGNTITDMATHPGVLPIGMQDFYYDGSSSDPLGPNQLGWRGHGTFPPVSQRSPFAWQRGYDPTEDPPASGTKKVFLGRLAGMPETVLAGTSQ